MLSVTICWDGNSNKTIFRIEKRVIRPMIGVNSRTSCKQLFKEINFLMLASLYILEVTCLKKKNVYICLFLELDSNVHKYNT